MRIAIPSHPFFAPLIQQIDEVAARAGHTVRRGSEDECARWIRTNQVDMALLSPLGYGQGVINSDYRIIPSMFCLLRGWTNTCRIVFAPNRGDVHSVVSSTPTDFIVQAAHIVLDEQYSIEVQIESATGTTSSLLESHDAVISWVDDADMPAGLDVSEEWDLAFGYSLPLAVWTIRSEFALDAGADQEAFRDSLIALTKEIAGGDIPALALIHEDLPIADTESRQGEIDFEWNDSSEATLDQTLQMLYYRQLLPEIPAVKLLGRD